MSYNKIKVGGQSPNTNGEIAVALNDLSDVDVSSASNGTLLKYDSGWTFGVPGFDTDDYVLLASNQTTGGVTSTYNTTTTNSILSDSRASGYGQAETKGTAVQFTHLYQSGTTFSGGQNKRYSGFELTANSKFLLIFTHTGRLETQAERQSSNGWTRTIMSSVLNTTQRRRSRKQKNFMDISRRERQPLKFSRLASLQLNTGGVLSTMGTLGKRLELDK